ncbi:MULTISPECIES: uroporphyrinogen-III synthase [Halolamina]|uniref:Uroporphyrinogen-III synthase n=1 Tax=Halolamina pelagica TaxID=699431 RepID=A0A1I5RM68_9EURY|nr:uroporphyrinogen-III synthase [Halolamina sp. R1-12]SFP59642.1 uroporphyrinogen-III synthase [Halolamina pelagica]
MSRPRVAVFRPDDGRIDDAAARLDSLGAEPVPDPMLTIEPTGETPPDADFVVLTSSTGVDTLADAGWEPGDAELCCIGPSTAEAAEAAGWTVDRVPAQYDSEGMVAELDGDVSGRTVALGRSDRASATMPEGLRAAGAEVSDTTLYRLRRPDDAGESAELAAEGRLDGAAFTASSTVEGFLRAADERGIRDAAVAGLDDAVVGAIAESPAETAREAGIEVDVVPEEADFEALARAVVERATPAE